VQRPIPSTVLANNWATIAQRGGLALFFSLVTPLRSDPSLAWFAPLFLFYAIADGVLAISAAARSVRSGERWACHLVEGLAGVCCVFLMCLWPDTSLRALTWTLASWATLTGIGALVNSAGLGKSATREFLAGALGVVLIRFGLLTIGAERAGEAGITRWACGNALLIAVLFLAWGARLRAEQTGRPVAKLLQLRAR